MKITGNGLDPNGLKKTYFALDELQNGYQYEALVTDINYSYSNPI